MLDLAVALTAPYIGVDSVQPSEVTFFLVALYAFLLWFRNWKAARADLRATREMLDGNGKIISARTGVRRARTLAFGPVLIMAEGLLLMTFTPNPAGSLASRWIVSALAIGLSFIFIYVARDQWKTRELARAHYLINHSTDEDNAQDKHEASQ